VLFRRPCHVPPCLINGEGGSTLLVREEILIVTHTFDG